MGELHFFFIVLQIFTSAFILFSNNPMHSILFMILLFFESAIVLALFNLDFFAFLFILVYVGAIAVLFLFIVMLLEVKVESMEFALYFPLSLLADTYLFVESYAFLQRWLFAPDLPFLTGSLFLSFGEFSPLLIAISQLLFNYYILCVLIAGYILLIALLGAISLSYDYAGISTRLYSYRKLSRSSNFISFFQ